MAFKINAVDVYVSDVVNKPGMLARILEALNNAGANLEFVIARRITANTARIFVAPLKGARVLKAAQDVGLVRAIGMLAVRIEGPDRPGLGAHMTRGLSAAGINLRGLSAASMKKRSVCYIAFADKNDQALGMKALKKLLK